MATTTRYHLVPDENRPSEDENAVETERLIASSIHSNHAPSKQHFHCSSHGTIYSRIGVICLLLPAFVILVIPGTPETIPVEIFSMICVIRNSQVLIFHFISPCFRIRFEVVGRSPSLPVRKTGRPKWLTRRYVEMGIDILIWTVLFITTTVIGSGLNSCRGRMYRGPSYACYNNSFAPGMIMTWLACGLYLFSLTDGGKPSTVTTSAGFVYDEENAPNDEVPSMLARGGLAVGTKSRKSGADSPVIV